MESKNVFTIFDYLDWRGDLSFDKSPFNDIDAAILSRFSYEPFDGIVNGAFRVSTKLEKACLNMLNKPNLADKVLYPDDDVLLIQKMFASERYKNIKLCGFVNDIDVENETQFSAIVFNLGEGNYFIAFRGTDNTIIAWKEDLNMGFEFPVPAQEKARAYFEKATQRLKEGTFRLGGHSKGGNLAIYASAYASDEFKNRIEAIYNFDGPGFTFDVLETPEFMSIKDKVKTFVPQFSIVGMLLEHIQEYSVVKSYRNGLMQHELMTWELTKDSFVTLDKIDPKSKFVDSTLTRWLNGLSKDEREQFVDTLYQVLSSGGATTFADINENKLDTVLAAIKNYQTIDDNAKKGVRDTLLSLVKSADGVLKKKHK